MLNQVLRKITSFSLKSKFLFFTISAIVIIGGLFSGYYIQESQNILINELETKARAIVQNLAYNSKYGAITQNKEDLNTLLEGVINEKDIIAALIYDDHGNVLSFISNNQQIVPIFKQNQINALPMENGYSISYNYEHTPPLMNVFAPIVSIKMKEKAGSDDQLFELGAKNEQTNAGNEVSSTVGYAQISLSLQKLVATKNTILKAGFTITLLIIIAMSFCSFGFVQLIIRPIKNMVATADQIAQGKLDLRVKEYSDDEIGKFAKSFNKMVDAIALMNEQLREAKDAAETANVAKSEFLANMSHEIRTPMNGIIGMAEVMQNGNMTKEQNKQLDIIQTSAHNLMSIINDILDFSKIESGKFSIESIDFDLKEILVNTLDMLAVQAGKKNLELIFHLPPKIKTALIGDPQRLQQIIINLVGNAIKFTEQGYVTIQINKEWQKENEIRLRFSIIDTGIGIPKEKQSVIFEPFTQADGSLTRRFGGTGLGLTISHQLVSLMNGKIWVESEPDKGSAFHFTANFGIQNITESKQTSLHITTLANLSVLGVDDNETNRLILKELLEHWQMKPTIVDSGQAALDLLEKIHQNGGTFSLILLDGHMPEMDGFTLAKKIRLNPLFANIPIIMLTSIEQLSTSDICKEIGINGYIKKPIMQSELLDTILLAVNKYPKSQQAATVTHPVESEAGFHLHVLLVEDNFINQEVTSSMLKQLGHKVTIANNGKKALEAVDKNRFDLILMDIQMPEMNGFEATAAIRQKEKESGNVSIPIIGFTAHALKADRESCLNAGMNGYVTKPINSKKLYKAIEEVIPVKDNSSGNIETVKNLHILLADDNPINQTIALDMLNLREYKVTVANNGLEALEALNKDSFDLILMDMQMPKMNGLKATAIIRRQEISTGNHIPIIAMTANSTKEDKDKCLSAGMDDYLSKPIVSDKLYNLIDKYAAMPKNQIAVQQQSIDSDQFTQLTDSDKKSLHILLVEDTLINQMVTTSILQEWGHAVAVANNGKEALVAMDKEAFNLVLMDIQMPEMNGYEATTHIRKKESSTQKHIPIIALTANNTEEDRDRCLKTGMDDFIPKPIDSNKLYNAIKNAMVSIKSKPGKTAGKQIVDKPPAFHEDPQKTTGSPIETFDKNELMARTSGKATLIKNLADLFIKNSPEMLADIQKSIAAKNCEELDFSAHKLKGSVSVFSANKAADLAYKLELMGKHKDLSKASVAFNLLDKEVERFKSELATFTKDVQTHCPSVYTLNGDKL